MDAGPINSYLAWSRWKKLGICSVQWTSSGFNLPRNSSHLVWISESCADSPSGVTIRRSEKRNVLPKKRQRFQVELGGAQPQSADWRRRLKIGLPVEIKSGFKDARVAGLFPVFFRVSFLQWQIEGFLPQLNSAAASHLPRLLSSHHSLRSHFDSSGVKTRVFFHSNKVVEFPNFPL